jgi:protein SCO1/2
MSRKLNRDGAFYKNRYSFMSLMIILAMYFIASNYYDPEGVVRKGSSVVTGTGAPNIGGDFSVLNHDGEVVTQAILDGKYSLIFFGFTHCPDICPSSMLVLNDVYLGLTEKQRQKVQVVLTSIDPERDTPEIMKDYVKTFHDDFIGLTGAKEQIKDMAKKYLVYHVQTEPDADGNYSVDHSGYIYFMGPDGRYMKHFSHKDKAEDILTVVQSYLRK